MIITFEAQEPEFEPEFDPREGLDDRDPEPEDGPLTEGEIADITEDQADAEEWFRSHELPECPAVEETVKAVGVLLADRAAARERIAHLEGLPVRREYAATIRPRAYPEPGNHVLCGTADLAFEEASRAGGTAWIRDVAEHPWIELAAEAPF